MFLIYYIYDEVVERDKITEQPEYNIQENVAKRNRKKFKILASQRETMYTS